MITKSGTLTILLADPVTEHKDSKKERLPGDEDYGTTGSEFYSYPYSGEAFNIVLNASKCKEQKITKISKVQVNFMKMECIS